MARLPAVVKSPPGAVPSPLDRATGFLADGTIRIATEWLWCGGLLAEE